MVGTADWSSRRVCPITGVRLNQYQGAHGQSHAMRSSKPFSVAFSYGSRFSRPTLSLESNLSLIASCRFRTVVT